MIDYFKLPFHFDPAALTADLETFAPDDWIAHFNRGYYTGDWSGISLRAVNGKHTTLYPDPLGTYADTPLLERCPYVRTVLEQFTCPLESVRFLKLAAGSSIRRHRDYQLGYEDGVVRLHIPVQTNRQVEFFLDGKQIVMEPGECWYLDFNQYHWVENHSTTDRVHLVIDCVVNEWLRSVFALASALP